MSSGVGPSKRLDGLRLLLLFCPELVAEPLEVLRAVFGVVDAVQVRVKPSGSATSPARELYRWTETVLELRAELRLGTPVFVNDRVDVAAALLDRGVDGVHLGEDDLDPRRARELLGEQAWIGLSTHDARAVLLAQDLPVDYLGFGPVYATRTKGYARGLGHEAAWIAANASALPLFPIGGIDASNANELAPVGRAAVAAGILCAPDPRAAAESIRAALSA